MQVAVGSLNPVKVEAVRASFMRHWPNAAVGGVSVPTGVTEMPLSDAECVEGARNRARAAIQQNDADFGVGLEGGVNEEAFGLMLLGWVVIVNRAGVEGLACTAKIPLPQSIAAEIRQGAELGPLMDNLLQQHDVRKQGGASGALSAGLVLRQSKFEMAVAYALSPFVAPQFY